MRPGTPRALLAVGCATLLVWLTAAVAAAAPVRCGAPAELVAAEFALPQLRARLHSQAPVTIVALGGGSTAGAAAGSPDLAYPHRLQEALAQRFPTARITVLNRGVPRQTAAQMLDRFPRDVLAAHPALVVWEAGITDAVREDDVEDFAATIQSGIDQLRAHRIDALLMDMQYSPKSTAIIDFASYLNAMHRVGEINGVSVFPRFEIMRYWSEAHMFDFDGAAPADRAKLAAAVYRCLADRLAETIAAAVR